MWSFAGMAAQLSLLRHPAAMLTFPVCVCVCGGHAQLCNSYQARDIFFSSYSRVQLVRDGVDVLVVFSG